MSEATGTTAGTPSAEYIASFRGYLRNKTSALDGEITDLINAARDDLVLGGVLVERTQDETDPLIKRAISNYVKAEFGLDNDDSEKYRAAYVDLKKRLLFSDKYIREEG